MTRLVLASGSPRRKRFLAELGISFEVVPSRADETLPSGLPVAAAIEAVAARKAREVRERGAGSRWVLGADTAVVLGERVFGKPRDRDDAVAMLRALSGRSHRVITGVALVGPGGEHSLAVETEVVFRALSGAQIAWYAASEEPYDKAGGYAIQGRGSFLVAAIRGSYTNVVGLPMAETVDLLDAAGLIPWVEGEGARAHG